VISFSICRGGKKDFSVISNGLGVTKKGIKSKKLEMLAFSWKA